MTLYNIRDIDFAELKVRNCASNSSCSEKTLELQILVVRYFFIKPQYARYL